MESLIELSRLPWIEIKVAGDGDDELVDKIVSSGNIKYLGYLSHDQIMSETKKSHFVFALYDPVRVINRYAAPNKVAEALSCGRPVIINSEVVISENIQGNDCGLVMTYGDVPAIAEGLEKLRKSPEDYQLLCQNARGLFEREYAWNIAKEKSIEVYDMALHSK
ncbi:Glycosyl transferases group 1 [compost metagenome]